MKINLKISLTSKALLAVLLVWGLFISSSVSAQNSISTAGVIESKSGGFKFPDGSIQISAAVAGSAPVEDTGEIVCWDAVGTVISCTGTGQDGELQAGVDWPAPRFTGNADGTVTDNLTGLVWLENADCFGDELWAEALTDANTLASGSCGLTDGSVAGDWRLPNIKELMSLVDYSQVNPILPPGHPFNPIQAFGWYWTSTTFLAQPETAWTVFMSNAVNSVLDKDVPTVMVYVWPVRNP